MIWYFILGCCPALMLPAVLGWLGADAQRAAGDMCLVTAIIVALFVVAYLVKSVLGL